MEKWWNWVLYFGLFCVMFIVVPLSLPTEKTKEQLKPVFNDYVKKFNKSYKSPEEYATRFEHFVASVREIERLNTQSTGPEHCRAKYGLTNLSDMSKTEFKDLHLSDEKMSKSPQAYGQSWGNNLMSDALKYDIDGVHIVDRPYTLSDNKVYVRKKRLALPLQVDWRTKGVIGSVKDQGLCGACWAFSSVGTIEAMHAINTGTYESLSVQEVIDCAGFGNSGCAGGDICLLLDWLMLTHTPVQREKDYPLRLTDGACRAKKNATGVNIKSYTCDDFVGNEDKILLALATHGPVAVAVNAVTWQNYLGGIIQYHCSGSPIQLNHAVVLVGYDLTGEVPYYIAKNSWGSEFGNDGYVNLAVGSNTCGLANEVATVSV